MLMTGLRGGCVHCHVCQWMMWPGDLAIGYGVGGQTLLDTVLPFGLRSAPAIYSAVADTLAIIVRVEVMRNSDHYLDDFILLGSPGLDDCQKELEVT